MAVQTSPPIRRRADRELTLTQDWQNPEYRALMRRFWTVTPYQRTCVACGDRFTTLKQDKRTCSHNCQMALHRQRQSRGIVA